MEIIQQSTTSLLKCPTNKKKCDICKTNIPNEIFYKTHVKLYHKYENFFSCIYCTPQRKFNKLKFFLKHFQSHLNDNIETEASNNYSRINSIKPPETLDIELSSFDSIVPSNTRNNTNNSETAESGDAESSNPQDIVDENHNIFFMTTIDIFVSEIYKNTRICRSDIQNMIEIFFKYHNSILNHLLHFIKTNISCLEIKLQKQKLLGLLEQSLLAYEYVSSEYKRTKLLSQNKSFHLSRQVTIGHEAIPVRINNQTIFKNTAMKASCTSIKTIIINFFNSTEKLDYCLQYVENLRNQSQCEQETTSNIVQSVSFNEKLKLYLEDENVLPIFLYFDEFETNNALGSHSGLQNLGALYLSFPFIPFAMRSKLENIFLVMLLNSLDRKKFGNAVFKDVVSELKQLEENGLIIFGRRYYFVLTSILGDNKGINSVLGFTDSFNANYFCRFCTMHRDETKYAVKERELLLRNKITYEDDLKKKSVSETGIVEECVFNELTNFHATENYVVDIMHDIQEGVLNFEMGMMLFDFIFIDKFFSLEILNERVRSFNYGEYDKINKPTEILESHIKLKKLRFSASETLTFAKYLPLIIGDLIPESNEKWKLFIILRKIIDIAFSESIDDSIIKCIENLVTDHHVKFLRLYNTKLRCKHHFLLHYATIMRQTGPLKQMCALRFESKHKSLKDIARSTTSRRDICKTIFNRIGFGSVVNSEGVINFRTNITFGKAFDNNRYSWISINNCKIKTNSILNIGNDGVYPNFFKVKEIIYDCSSNSLKLILFELKTLYFDDHFYSFCVEETNSVLERLVETNEFFNKFVLIKLNKKYYIIYL